MYLQKKKILCNAAEAKFRKASPFIERYIQWERDVGSPSPGVGLLSNGFFYVQQV